MAQKVVVSLEDDIDGGVAAETVSFALDGKTYEIDLSEGNSAKLRDALSPYVSVARRASSGRRAVTGSSTRGGTTSEHRERNQQIRSWAKSNGYEVNDRGRISAEVIEAYDTERPETDNKVSRAKAAKNTVEFSDAAKKSTK